MSNVDKLFQLDEEREHHAPVGMEFAPSGWYGPFSAAIVYGVGWLAMDLEQLALDFDAGLTTALENIDEITESPFINALRIDGNIADDIRVGRKTGKFKYYYLDRERAEVLARLVDLEEPKYTKTGNKFPCPVEQRWRIETPLVDVLSLTSEAKAKFERDALGWEVELKAIQNNSPNWYRWHGLALPSLVSAYARLVGWDGDQFDIKELTAPADEVIVTREFQLKMIGDARAGGKPEVKLETSLLTQRRQALWKALGEDDWKVSNAADVHKDAVYLSAALKVAMSNWETPVYCRVIQVPDPHPEATQEGRDGAVEQSSVTVVTDFYRSKSAAQAAWDAEKEARQGNGNGQPTPVADKVAEFHVPKEWTEIADAWPAAVREIKAKIGKRPLPAVKIALEGMKDALAKDYMVTVDDVLETWNQV